MAIKVIIKSKNLLKNYKMEANENTNKNNNCGVCCSWHEKMDCVNVLKNAQNSIENTKNEL